MNMNRVLRVAGLAILISFQAGPAEAGAPSAAVAYQRQSTKQLTDFKLAIKTPAADLIVALDAFSAAVVDMLYVDFGPLEELAAALDTAYGQLEQQTRAQWLANSAFGHDLMKSMEDPSSFDPVAYPMDFYAGSGGARDRFAAGLIKHLDTSLSPARKRAAKVMATLAKPEVGVNLTLQLLTPVQVHNAIVAFNPGTTMQLEKAPVNVEYIVAGSSRDVTEDGFILIGGQFDVGNGDLSLQRSYAIGSDTLTVKGSSDIVTSQVAGHWYALLGFGEAGPLTEGNHIVTIRQSDVPVLSLTIGVP